MKIGNFFLASIFLQSVLIVCGEEKTKVKLCQEYAGKNREYKVEYERQPNETIAAEVFYYVNYANVNYSVKNSTVDCKYLLYLL